jgi:hypothetical protein
MLLSNGVAVDSAARAHIRFVFIFIVDALD